MAKVRLGPGSALVLFILAYCAVYAGIHVLAGVVGHLAHPRGVQARVALTLGTSVLLLWTELGALLVVLRLRGQSFGDIGWRRPAAFWGWLAAAVVAILYVGFMLAGPVRGAPLLTDWSAFRIVTALGAGVSAGVCEEAIFRGFVMTQARAAGLPVALQIALSALLFGLAHAGWGSVTGRFDLGVFVGAAGATAVLGALLALVYLFSRRSLTPVMVAHAGIDLCIEPWLVLYALGGGFAHLAH